MLDRTITAEKYNELPDDVKAHYVKRGSSYVIDLNGSDPELSATQEQLDKERKKSIELASQVRSLSDELTTKEEKIRKESSDEIEKLKATNKALTETQIESERSKHIEAIASNFKLDHLIRADLQGRVNVEIVDGQVKTTFKNKDGAEVDFKTLNEEYCKNPDYSAILKSGSTTTTFTPPKAGTETKTPGGQGGSGGELNYATATPAEIAAHLTKTVPN